MHGLKIKGLQYIVMAAREGLHIHGLCIDELDGIISRSEEDNGSVTREHAGTSESSGESGSSCDERI